MFEVFRRKRPEDTKAHKRVFSALAVSGRISYDQAGTAIAVIEETARRRREIERLNYRDISSARIALGEATRDLRIPEPFRREAAEVIPALEETLQQRGLIKDLFNGEFLPRALAEQKQVRRLLERKLPADPLRRQAVEEVRGRLAQEYDTLISSPTLDMEGLGQHAVDLASFNTKKYLSWVSGTNLGQYLRETRRVVYLGHLKPGLSEKIFLNDRGVCVNGDYGWIILDKDTLHFWWYEGSYPQHQRALVKKISQSNGYEATIDILKAIG